MDVPSDWDRPFSQDELDAIEAAFDTLPSLPNKRTRINNVEYDGSTKSCRRLPQWGSQQSSNHNLDHGNQHGVSKPDGENSPVTHSASIFRPWKIIQPSHPVKLRCPSFKFGGRIVYCRTVPEVEKAMKDFMEIMEAKLKSVDQVSVGFDIEWKPVFRRGAAPTKAAVLQLCGDNSHCYVIQIIHSGIPPILRSFLQDSRYLKVGVCIAGDAYKVLNDYNVCIKALEDLSAVANKKLSGMSRSWSLASLTEMLTCKQLEKPSKIRMGNWEADVLSKDQLMYAATDAFASWQVYEILRSFPDASDNQNDEKVNS